MERTIEVVEAELAQCQAELARLMDHTLGLGEVIRQASTANLQQIKIQNDAYQEHNNYMAVVAKGMREYVERNTSKP